MNLRIRLIQKPAVLDRMHRIVFGLQATPAKPMPEKPNWRTVGDKFKWGFAGMCTYYGCPYYSIRPWDQDYTIIRKVAEAKKLGKRDEKFAEQYIKAHPESRGELGAGLGPAHADAVVPYTNILGEGPPDHAWVVYQDEWKCWSFPAWHSQEWMNFGRKTKWSEARNEREVGGGVDFVVFPTRSRQDYLLYYYRELFRNGFDSLYWDNIYLLADNNPVREGAYVRDDGQVQSGVNIWELREVTKRTAVLLHQMGKPNANMVHMTNACLIPVFSWAGFSLDWEWKYGMDDFQDRFTADYIRAASMGRHAGTVPNILGGILPSEEGPDGQWADRTRTAVCLPHEIDIWGGGDHRGTLRKAHEFFWKEGYGTSSCIVHHYWDDKPVARVTRGEALFLILETAGRVILEISDFGEGGPICATLDTKRLGLAADFVATNWENPKDQAKAQDGTIKIDNFKRHDFRIWTIPKVNK